MAQRDPLVEYKQEGFNLFESFLKGIDLKLASRLLKVEVIDESQLQAFGSIKTNQDQVEDILTGSREMLGMMRDAVKNVVNESAQTTNAPRVQKTVINDAKVGRNDPCPCGSGKKYKKCHGR
jgi:preprotein translocase subunit SecA